MNDQQVPALRPLRISPASKSHDLIRSPAALKGATSAFLPRSPSPTVSVSPASAGARLAAFAAGINAQQRATIVLPERQDKNREQSPQRGRQIYSRSGLASDAGRTAASSVAPIYLSKPVPLTRSSSTLAAQHAANRSRSPQKGLSRSQLSHGSGADPNGDDDSHTQNLDALTGATASMTASIAREQARIEPVKSHNPQMLNFEKIPLLSGPGTSQISKDIVDANHLFEKHPSGLFISSEIPSFGNFPTPTRGRSHSATRLRPPRPKVFRESSAENAVTLSTVSATNIDGPGRSSQQGGLSIPPRSLSTIPLSSSGGSPHRRFRQRDDNASTMTVNELADAMVASSLASSRGPSPPKMLPPPMPRRRSRSIPTLREAKFPIVKEHPKQSHKLPRPMKHTLRKHTSSDDDVELTRRGRRHWMRKHPNMHSEGDRKRWRDKVTERERKRYEGVFAANRGLMIGPGYFEPTPLALSDNTAQGNKVVNIVVRDIWERSRLPMEVLKEVYDLVSPEESHALNREQFVVGLWLIDQRLKGRKLPVKVSTSVWSSVRHSQGIKVKRHV